RQQDRLAQAAVARRRRPPRLRPAVEQGGVEQRSASATDADMSNRAGRLCLSASGAAEILGRLSGGLERRGRILRRHRHRRLYAGQAAAGGGRQDGGGRGLLVRELADREPVMGAEGQVPTDEPAAHALVQRGNHILAIFRLGQHALDRVRRETTARDIDRHDNPPETGLPPPYGRPKRNAAALATARDAATTPPADRARHTCRAGRRGTARWSSGYRARGG